MDDVGIEITYSQTEKIGLANWSSISLMASGKITVADAQASTAYDFLSVVTRSVLQEESEKICRELNIWGGENTFGTITPQEKEVCATEVLGAGLFAEIVFSRIEVVGLPEKSNVNILASNKKRVPHGGELNMFRNLAQLADIQMKEKRTSVLADPRPWTQTK